MNASQLDRLIKDGLIEVVEVNGQQVFQPTPEGLALAEAYERAPDAGH